MASKVWSGKKTGFFFPEPAGEFLQKMEKMLGIISKKRTDLVRHYPNKKYGTFFCKDF